MTNFSTITDHPDFDEIVAKIVTGTVPKDIAQWLKIKYSSKDQKHLALSAKLLQEFANKHVDLEKQLRQDVLAKKGVKDVDFPNRPISPALLKNSTYQERLVEIAGEEVDLKRMIKELVLMCRARMEQVFDKIQENPTQLGKADYTLIKYFEMLFMAMEKFDKIVNNAPDQVIQHNVTVQAIEQHSVIFQEAIRETLACIDSEAAALFMEIFTEKVRKLKEPVAEGPLTLNQKRVDIQAIREIVLPALETNLDTHG